MNLKTKFLFDTILLDLKEDSSNRVSKERRDLYESTIEFARKLDETTGGDFTDDLEELAETMNQELENYIEIETVGSKPLGFTSDEEKYPRN